MTKRCSLKRAGWWANVVDPSVGFARGRHADGTWDSPFDPAGNYAYITEGLPYQYTFFVPQDVEGLIQRVGGREKFIEKLDGLFASKGYDHGNEPSHHIAYLYDYAGAPWKTQQQVRRIMDQQYMDRGAGMAGNDDAGQMSAWFVLSSLGFYTVAPGTPVYQIGTPLFDQATVRLPSGKTFRVEAKGRVDREVLHPVGEAQRQAANAAVAAARRGGSGRVAGVRDVGPAEQSLGRRSHRRASVDDGGSLVWSNAMPPSPKVVHPEYFGSDGNLRASDAI